MQTAGRCAPCAAWYGHAVHVAHVDGGLRAAFCRVYHAHAIRVRHRVTVDARQLERLCLADVFLKRLDLCVLGLGSTREVVSRKHRPPCARRPRLHTRTTISSRNRLSLGSCLGGSSGHMGTMRGGAASCVAWSSMVARISPTTLLVWCGMDVSGHAAPATRKQPTHSCDTIRSSSWYTEWVNDSLTFTAGSSSSVACSSSVLAVARSSRTRASSDCVCQCLGC